jgi:surface antigen Omp85-like protein
MASKRFVTLALLAAGLVLVSRGARAQDADSRAAELAALQQEKARALTPYKPGVIERELLSIEHAGGFGVAHGLFVTFGDIKRGSGPSIGPAYGRTFASGAVLLAKAVYSIQNAKVAQVSLQAPPLANHRLTIRTRVRWQDVPDVTFHGLSPGARTERAEYAETKTEASVAAAFRPVRVLRFGAGVGLERFETSANVDSTVVGTTLFSGVPGVNADPRYLHGFGSAAIDSRDGEGYSRHGSLLRATLHDYRQQNDGQYSFQRVDGVAEQYVPILGGNWVLYVGLHGSTTTVDSGESVPFFLMPDLGGHDLRGFGNYRFQNRHSLLATAEYRWYAQEFLDGAIFYDAGKAVARRADLDFRGLNHSYGAGIRLHGAGTTAMRVEVARSREGTRLIIAFSPVGG